MKVSARTRLVVLTTVALGVVAVGVAYASIPDSNGVIHGCYLKVLGTVRVIDSPSQQCSRFEVPIQWNQQGVPGTNGTNGTNGATGPTGATGATGPAAPAITGSFNATTCTQEVASSAYSVSLVTTGTDAPYCKVLLTGFVGIPVAPATSFGAAFPAVVTTQGASGLDFQVWNLAGTNETGQPGAGYVDFAISTPTP